MQETLSVVAERYGVSVKDLKSKSRLAIHAKPRMIFYWIAYRALEKTYPEIGRFLNRDHTTIVHGVRAVRERKMCNWDLANDIIDEVIERKGNDGKCADARHIL